MEHFSSIISGIPFGILGKALFQADPRDESEVLLHFRDIGICLVYIPRLHGQQFLNALFIDNVLLQKGVFQNLYEIQKFFRIAVSDIIYFVADPTVIWLRALFMTFSIPCTISSI